MPIDALVGTDLSLGDVEPWHPLPQRVSHHLGSVEVQPEDDTLAERRVAPPLRIS